MWLLAGVRLLRALRMSHRFTFSLCLLHVPFLVGLVCSVCLCCVVLVVFGSLFCMCGRLSF